MIERMPSHSQFDAACLKSDRNIAANDRLWIKFYEEFRSRTALRIDTHDRHINVTDEEAGVESCIARTRDKDHPHREVAFDRARHRLFREAVCATE